MGDRVLQEGVIDVVIDSTKAIAALKRIAKEEEKADDERIRAMKDAMDEEMKRRQFALRVTRAAKSDEAKAERARLAGLRRLEAEQKRWAAHKQAYFRQELADQKRAERARIAGIRRADAEERRMARARAAEERSLARERERFRTRAYRGAAWVGRGMMEVPTRLAMGAGALGAATYGIQRITELGDQAANVEMAFAKATGGSAKASAALKRFQQAAGGTVSRLELMGRYMQGMNLGMFEGRDAIEAYAKGIENVRIIAATIPDLTPEEAVSRFVRGVGKNEIEFLDELGVSSQKILDKLFALKQAALESGQSWGVHQDQAARMPLMYEAIAETAEKTGMSLSDLKTTGSTMGAALRDTWNDLAKTFSEDERAIDGIAKISQALKDLGPTAKEAMGIIGEVAEWAMDKLSIAAASWGPMRDRARMLAGDFTDEQAGIDFNTYKRVYKSGTPMGWYNPIDWPATIARRVGLGFYGLAAGGDYRSEMVRKHISDAIADMIKDLDYSKASEAFSESAHKMARELAVNVDYLAAVFREQTDTIRRQRELMRLKKQQDGG